MKNYVVLYRIHSIMSDLDAPFGYECTATNTEDAEQQCLNNTPDADIVWVVDCEQYQEALDNYFGSSLNQ